MNFIVVPLITARGHGDGLLVAIVIVIVLLTIGLGWRESIVVAVAIRVVFGLTLACNLMLGFTINRVTRSDLADVCLYGGVKTFQSHGHCLPQVQQ